MSETGLPIWQRLPKERQHQVLQTLVQIAVRQVRAAPPVVEASYDGWGADAAAGRARYGQDPEPTPRTSGDGLYSPVDRSAG